MYKNRKGLTINIHRLMAYTYLKHTKDSNLIIDHKDNNPENNSIVNLQLVTLRKNLTKDKKNKTSKYPGVHWSMEREKWIASITLNKKHMYLGGFDVEEEAYLTYYKAIKFCYLFKDNVKLFRLELKDLKLNETPELLNA